jgi:hypothetical protein
MIEYTSCKDPSDAWHTARPEMKLRPDYFESVYFRIGDTIYCYWSDEFEAAIMWEKLKNDKSSVLSSTI